MSQEHRILLLSCSQQKREEPDQLPALERYDGPAFKVVRKFLREHPHEASLLSIIILSAKFGLISADQSIPYYDQQMTPIRAQELRPQVHSILTPYIQDAQNRELYIHAGRAYLLTLRDYEYILTPRIEITVCEGTLGGRLTKLRNWLRRNLAQEPVSSCDTPPGGRPRIRGIELAFTPTEILDTVRKSLSSTPEGAKRFQSWYVEVDSARISPKWVVSQLTGLPVRSFHTSDAKRVLEQLDIPVYAAEPLITVVPK